MTASPGVFDEVRSFPDPSAARRFGALVGLDTTKLHLLKEARLLLDPCALETWAQRHHGSKPSILSTFRDRPPLFIFAGDVGTGKTALAESFGDPIARELGIGVTLYCLSLTARGTGAVGQMTALLAGAFDEIRDVAKRSLGSTGKPKQAVVLLIDEADALAQSREAAQMHHEDRAGVNAVIRGVDDLAADGLPAIIVMCTNRLDALDPAVRHRAAATFLFERPNDDQRRAILAGALTELGLSERDIAQLVTLTGPTKTSPYGFTFSDLTQRLLPAIILDAFPDEPVTADRAMDTAGRMQPTPPFRGEHMDGVVHRADNGAG